MPVCPPIPEAAPVPRPKEALGHGPRPCPQKAPAAGGTTWPLSHSPHLAQVPHLQVDVRLQGLNKIKTDSVEPYSGLSYKGLTQLSLSELILSVLLSSSGCYRPEVRGDGEYNERSTGSVSGLEQTGTKRGRGRCVSPEEQEALPVLQQQVPESQ